MNLLVLLIISIVALILIILGGNWYVKFIYKIMVQDKIDYIEEIMISNNVPQVWFKQYIKLTNLLKTDNMVIIRFLDKYYQWRNLSKLKKLVRFLKVTNVIESEEVKKIQLSNLEGLYKQLYEEKVNEKHIKR